MKKLMFSSVALLLTLSSYAVANRSILPQADEYPGYKTENGLSTPISTRSSASTASNTNTQEPSNKAASEGCISGDCINGHGVYVWENGDRYEGDWAEAQKNGQGVIVWSNSEKYDGQWKNDQQDGQGTMIFSNGDQYTGEWTNGQRNGQGTMKWANGTRYEGIWKNNEQTEQGKTTFANNASQGGTPSNANHPTAKKPSNNSHVQEGCVSGDCANGQGVHISDIGRYEGMFKNHKPNGKGVYILTNGNRFEGIFKDWKVDKLDGHCIIALDNGYKFDGMFKNDKKNGKGIETIDGKRYEGIFKDDMKNGKFIMISTNGDHIEGIFKNDKPDGKFVGVFANGIRMESIYKDGKEISVKGNPQSTLKSVDSSSRSMSSGSSSTTQEVALVHVHVAPLCGSAKDLKLSGGSNMFTDITNSQGQGGIMKGFGGKKIAGQYDYSVRIEDSGQQQFCSGSFYVDGTKSQVMIHIPCNSCQADVSSF